jgi:hypothetical protein
MFLRWRSVDRGQQQQRNSARSGRQQTAVIAEVVGPKANAVAGFRKLLRLRCMHQQALSGSGPVSACAGNAGGLDRLARLGARRRPGVRDPVAAAAPGRQAGSQRRRGQRADTAGARRWSAVCTGMHAQSRKACRYGAIDRRRGRRCMLWPAPPAWAACAGREAWDSARAPGRGPPAAGPV